MATQVSSSKPIVVAVDGSPESASALRWAANHAAVRGDGLRIVTTYALPVPTAEVAGEYSREILIASRAARTRAEVTIAEVLGHTEVDHFLRLGQMERVLVDASRGASLVVVGTRTSTTWWSRLRGSVADRIKGAAHCPVVSIPSDSPVLDQSIAA